MIAKVVRGYRPAGLLRYLFGPGKAEEHKNPRVIAAWDGAPWFHQPDKLTSVVLDGEAVHVGEFDFDLRLLTLSMQEMAKRAKLPLGSPPAITPDWADRVREGRVPVEAPWWLQYYKYDPKKKTVVLRPGYVWHTPVRLHPDDPTLTDALWESIAERLMKATGIHQAGCRWIAVRHADDHIHLMATLVSEVTGKPFHPFRDYVALRKECQALERELGLTLTADMDKTAVKHPTRQEKGKAERTGRVITAREELRRVVAQAAASTRSGEEFFAALKLDGVDARAVVDGEGMVRGYSVGLSHDLTAAGTRVRYSGGKLATDLTWPKLQARWAEVPPASGVPRRDGDSVTPAERRVVLEEATRVTSEAARMLRAERVTDLRSEVADGITHATGEVLVVLARAWEGRGGGPLTDVVANFDRAARAPYHVLTPKSGDLGRALRHLARDLASLGAMSRHGNGVVLFAALVVAAGGLVVEISRWLESRGRSHQANAANHVAGHLAEVIAPQRGRQVPRSTPRPKSAAERPTSSRLRAPDFGQRGRGRS